MQRSRLSRVRRPASGVLPSVEAMETRQLLSASPATVRAQDRPAWRGIVRAVQAGSPRAWSRILSAFRTHFPDTPGVLARELGAATSTPSRALPLGPNFDLGTRWRVTGATQAELLTNQLG